MENFKEKYEKALERARELNDKLIKEGTFATSKGIEAIFPELNESKDERLRKEIIYYLNREITLSEFGGEIAPFKEWIAWLEKQGKVKHTCRNCQTFQDLHQNCPYSPIYQCTDLAEAHKHLDDETNCEFWREKQGEPQVRTGLEWVNTIDDACEHRYAEEYAHGEYCHQQSFRWGFQEGVDWLEKQGEKIDAIENFDTEFEKQVSYLIASIINKEHEYNEGFVKWTANALLNYAKQELEKQGEIFESIKHKEAMLDCQTCANYKNECFPDRNIFKCSYPIKYSEKDILDIDEKQDEQKPAWSEEDENMLNNTIDTVELHLNHVGSDRKEILLVKEEISWLKSLKERMKGE